MTTNKVESTAEKNTKFIYPVEEINFSSEPSGQISTKLSDRWFIESDSNWAAQEIYDKELDRVCIAKRISENFRDAVEVASTMETLAQNSYSVPKIYSIVKNNEDYWLVMEKISGSNLAEYIKNGGKLNKEQLLFIYFEISEANRILAENNIFHGDLQARNIVLDENHHGYPRLIDFDAALLKGKEKVKTVNSRNYLDVDTVDINTLEQTQVLELVRNFSFALGYSRDTQMQKDSEEITNELQRKNPKSFSDLSKHIMSSLGRSKEEMEQVRSSYFN